MISFDHVTKLYGETHALSDVSVTIQDGEFVFPHWPIRCRKNYVLEASHP